MCNLRSQMRYLNPYDIHKLIINEYVLRHPGDTAKLRRDSSKDRTDYHVIKDNHKFLWDEDDSPITWEAQFAKRYYDKLFKEYCIGDLSLYKENKIALRWRTEQEVIVGKGQFICGNKKCVEKGDLKTWEVNFKYVENNERKNALVKIRLCPDCSQRLNYHSKKREVKRLSKKSVKNNKNKEKKLSEEASTSTLGNTEKVNSEEMEASESISKEETEEMPWESHKPEEVKSRDEEMDEYLQDLLL